MTAVLFDLDGVLANSGETIMRCINAALVSLGHGTRTEAQLRPAIGPPTEIGFGRLLGVAPDAPEVTAAVEAYRARYVDALVETRPYDGIPEAVAAIAAEHPVAVATSKPHRYALPVLEAIGLAGVFAHVAGPRPGGPNDKPAMVAEATEAMGGAAVMIGDRRYDMEAARGAGLFAVGVLWGYGTREELLEAGADVLVGAPADLPATVASRSTSRWTTGP